MPGQPRSSAAPKLTGIIEAAAHTFALAGYQRTQMADIASRARVALGTLYRYSDSKEDLFAYALAYGVGEGPAEIVGYTPVRDVEAFFSAHVSRWFAPKDFECSLFHGDTPASPATAFAALYDVIDKHKLTIRIIDRSAHDLPRLGEEYSTRVRQPVLHALVSYLDAQQRAGAIGALSDVHASARFALEVCAWFAMHRLFSPGGDAISDDMARQTALHHLTAAFRS